MSFKNNRIFFIAEAGVNHNGSMKNVLKMVDIASESGADAIKFQTFKASNLVTENAQKANYQLKTTNNKDKSSKKKNKK